METKTRIAVFDPEAFYPFRTLVGGPISSQADLESIEEFLRAIVLHDEMEMEVQPLPFDGEEAEWTEEEKQAGGRMVIAAIAPLIGEYNLFNDWTGPNRIPEIQLSPALERLVRIHSEAEPGNIYYEAHLNFLKRILEKVQNGGSIVCKGSLVQEAVQTATAFPAELFQQLDQEWQQFGDRLTDSAFGPLVPPVLSIVLTRSASREKIPTILRDLRDEWAVARSKVWNLADALKTSRTVAEAKEIDRELSAASKYFSPFSEGHSSRPVQVLWELVVGAAGGAVTARLSGGDSKIGAATGLVGQALRLVQRDSDFGRILFGRGAFDLAKRVRREIARVELDKLKGFLSDSEKSTLGL